MENKQLNINFSTHEVENNAESQKHLHKNRRAFIGKVKIVYDWLMEDRRLKVLECANEGVASLPRRILDLKDMGFRITDEWENGVKVYFLSPKDKSFNQEHQKTLIF